MANETMGASPTETMSPGQIEDLLNKIRDAGHERGVHLPRVLVQRVLGDKNIGMACFGVFQKKVQKEARAMGTLATRGFATITLQADHNPNQFYQSGFGLSVFKGFHERVLTKAKPSAAGTVHRFVFVELVRSLSDAEIETSLPSNYLFDKTVACAIIASLIAEQPNGEQGTLLNNGYPNLLYMSDCVTRVSWYNLKHAWELNTHTRGGGKWGAGSRVLFPATEA